MSAENLSTEMRELLERAEAARLTEAADWIRQQYFGTEPPLDSGIAWCVWYSRNYGVAGDLAFDEWKRRTDNAALDVEIIPEGHL